MFDNTVIHIRSLQKNVYYDTDVRLLHGMMSLLVDFVEIELAHLQLNCIEHTHALTLKQQLFYCLPRFLQNDELIRSRELGVAYLDFEQRIEKSAPKEEQRARIVKELYIWWTDERPKRVAADEKFKVFLRELKERHVCLATIRDEVEKQAIIDKENELIKEMLDLEKKYENEDTEMLKRLIDIRGYLWT